MRKFLAAAGALGLSVGLIGTGTSVALAEEPDRPTVKAVCENRLCLLVLDSSADSDGDGVADIDEEALGTDARDPRSRPEAKEVFDHVLARELPSFEQHLTELVALPRNKRDGALDSPLGTFEKPEKGGYLQSVEGLLGDLRANGFENVGTTMTVTLNRPPAMSETERLMFTGLGNVALYGVTTDSGFKVEGLVGPTSYGVNGHKNPTGITDRGFGYGEKGIGHEYSVGYEDGSWDDVSTSTQLSDGGASIVIGQVTTSYNEWGRPAGTSTSETETRYTAESGGFSSVLTTGTRHTSHTDENGNVTASSVSEWYHSETTFEDGTSTSFTRTIAKTYDAKGNLTEETVSTHEESFDGTKESEEVVTQYDENGQTSKTVTRTTTSPDGTTTTTKTVFDGENNVVYSETCDEGSDCPEEDQGVEDEGIIYDPDSVGIGPITAQDLARVAAGLNAARTPSRDGYGEVDSAEPLLPGTEPICGGIMSDGVLVISSGESPLFNKALPEYDSTLNELIDLSGATPPITETQPVFWP